MAGVGRGQRVVGHVIFNLLCQMEGVGHVFSNHSKCSGPTVHGGGGGGWEGRLYFLTSQKHRPDRAKLRKLFALIFVLHMFTKALQAM